MSNELSPELEAKIKVYHDKWVKIGLNCDLCDFEKSKDAARRVYADAGLVCPENFYLTDGPIDCAKLCANLRIKKEGLNIEPDSPKYWDLVYTELNNQIFGSHEAGWLAYYDFIWKEMNISDCEKLAGLIEIAQHCGWWAPYDDVVVFQHRHESIFVDSEMRLHNENGPCVTYRDGTKVWSIGGLPMNEKIVMTPDLLTVQEIDNETNNEVRAVMIQRLGWTNYIKNSGAVLLDSRDNPIENTIEALYNTKQYGKRFVVTCPTGRMFVLGVHDKVNNCEQAQKWLGNEERYDMKVNVIART